MLRIAVEVMVCRGPQAIDAVAEIDARQIARENLLLRQPGLQPERDDDFLRLALHRPVARQEAGLRELLRDGRSPLLHAAAAHVCDGRARHTTRIDSPMAIEAAVLNR